MLSCRFDTDSQFCGLNILTFKAFLIASSRLWISGDTILQERECSALVGVCELRERWRNRIDDLKDLGNEDST